MRICSWGSVLMLSALVPACSLPTSVTGTNDTGIAPPDAFVGGHDVGPQPVDMGTDAWAADIDAWVPPDIDAWVPPQPDAWVAPQPDAWVAPPASCDDIFGGISGYMGCASLSTATTCAFYANTNNGTCDTACQSVTGSTCSSAADNATTCTAIGTFRSNQCNDNHGDQICICNRP